MTDLHQNRHVSAVPAKDVPFGGLDDDQSRLGVKTPKNQNFGGVNRHFKPNLQKIQIVISPKHRISIKFERPMQPNEWTSWVVLYDDVTNPRWRTAAILDFDFGP